MTATYLETIVDAHRARAAQDHRAWRGRLGEVVYDGPSFYDALVRDPSRVAVIAEIKRRSPSKGWLNDELDVVGTARHYETGGAAAISVLTDEDFFSGSVADLQAVGQAVSLPLLRKDFTVSANDVIDAAHMGAAAVLLIVAALSDAELEEFLMVASACHLDALVEVHDDHEAQRALAAGARIVGVNQRDLRTFEVDPRRAAAVVTALPSTVLAVAESGLASVEDVARVAEAGVDAVLVGETFIRAASPEGLVHDFSSVGRHARD